MDISVEEKLREKIREIEMLLEIKAISQQEARLIYDDYTNFGDLIPINE